MRCYSRRGTGCPPARGRGEVALRRVELTPRDTSADGSQSWPRWPWAVRDVSSRHISHHFSSLTVSRSPPRDDQPDNDRADPASDQRGRVGPLPKAEVEQDEPGDDEDIREARLHRVPFRPMAGRLTLEIAAGFFCISPRASRISRSENGVDTLPISRIAKI